MAFLRAYFSDFKTDKLKRHQFIISALAFLSIVIVRSQHDYTAYQKHWTLILAGHNPFTVEGNTYGPLHILLAGFFFIQAKLPRLLFAVCTLGTTFFLVRLILSNDQMPEKVKQNLKKYLYFNPLFWVFVVFFGSNDGLLSALFLFGLVAFQSRKWYLSAFLLASGTLLKFIPVFVMPVLGLNRRKIHWGFGLTYLFVFGGVFLLCVLKWGATIFDPLLYNSERESKMLSVFMFLRGKFSPLPLIGIEGADHLSLYFVIGSIFITFILHLWFGFDHLLSVVLTLSGVLLFYRVGHHQFHLSLVFLLVFFIATHYESIQAIHPKACTCAWWYLGWIAFATILYAATEGYYKRFEIIRDIIGLPSFIIHLLMQIHLTVYGVKKRVALRKELPAVS